MQGSDREASPDAPVSGASGSLALHRYAVATALAAYVFIVIGGLVHSTGASFACPDWPLCHGRVLPQMTGTVAVEHGHRLAAALVSALTLGLAVWLTRSAVRVTKLPVLGWAAVALVAAQALLGGLGVLFRLPTTVSALHTGLSLVFFLTLFYLAAQTAAGAAARAELAPGARRLALVAGVSVLFQAILGGLVRHSGAALACRDFPLCDGALWPDAHVTVHVHVLHRFGAFAVAVLVFAAGLRTFRAAAGRPWLRVLAVASPVLVCAQILLGVRSVQTFLDLVIVQAHLAVGCALLASTWAVYLLSAPPRQVSAGRTAFRPQLRAIVELTKPRITTMVVITFIGGLWMAPGTVELWRVAMSLAGTVLIVSAANALNMFYERDVDGAMERTRRRPLVEGRLSPEVAIAVGTCAAAAAVPLLFLGGNLLTGLLGLSAFVSYVWMYTPLKRRSATALWVGAVPGALPPLMGWTTGTGRMDAGGLVLFAILFIWQIPHFLAIALFRAQDYGRAGIKVLPLTHGERAARWHIVVWSVALLAASVLLQPLGVANTPYTVSAALLGLVFLGWGIAGFRTTDLRRWAKSLFLVSIVYLTLLFVVLAIDHQLFG